MKVYVCSDLHAQYKLWQQIKNYLNPNDILYCLGDVIDRGDASLEIFNEMMEMNNVIFLLGNHENFIANIGKHFIMDKYDEYHDQLLSLWYHNGARNTINTFFNMTIKEKLELIHKIKELPTNATYTNKNGDIIYLTHAGRQPNDKEYFTKYGSCWIWDREHIGDIQWYGKPNEYCVHGHTPVAYMRDYLDIKELNKLEPIDNNKILRYCDGHKIDIDLCSSISHTACLLDLDTLQPIYFTEETENE